MHCTSDSNSQPRRLDELSDTYLQMTSAGVPRKTIMAKLGISGRKAHEIVVGLKNEFRATSLPNLILIAERQGVLR